MVCYVKEAEEHEVLKTRAAVDPALLGPEEYRVTEKDLIEKSDFPTAFYKDKELLLTVGTYRPYVLSDFNIVWMFPMGPHVFDLHIVKALKDGMRNYGRPLYAHGLPIKKHDTPKRFMKWLGFVKLDDNVFKAYSKAGLEMYKYDPS